MSKVINVIGRKFDRLTVLHKGPKTLTGRSRWWCECICGNYKLVTLSHLRSGDTCSCGCARIKHNQSNTRTYKSWDSMKQRCYNIKSDGYKNYGARGIFICRRWRNSFENFLKDMGERPVGRTLDKINNNGSYGKWNCQWATYKQQANNRREKTYAKLIERTVEPITTG